MKKPPPMSCASDGQCPPATPYCDQVSSKCIQCVADTNCDGAKHFCGADGSCVECLAEGDCGPGRVCDLLAYRCVPACASKDACPPMTPYCDVARTICVQCVGDGNCTESKPVCQIATGVCVQCNTPAECPPDRPFCDPVRNDCVACVADEDCPAPQKCETMQRRCM